MNKNTITFDPNIPIGRRIHIVGNSSAGKSTLGAQLAAALDMPFVELDALQWEPNWVALSDTNPEELTRRLTHATEGDEWVVAGSYMKFSQAVFWPRLETVIWLDLPVYQLVWRMLTRSWKRAHSKELLWGTNYERFWPQLKFWNKEDSLLGWIVTQQQRKRRNMHAHIADPRWQHIQFIHLQSSDEIKAFAHAKGCPPIADISFPWENVD